jgi:23S rRNA (uracil1939-C5)-methyltransferase|tara:strand:+ start:4017 stop:5414 length:1398 start_codon:yes stop_codon:yes gene_type:complete
MGSKRKNFSSIELVDIGSKGQSIGKSDEGIVLMVKNGVPGDIVDIETFRKKKKYFLGNITKYHSYSKYRTDPKCEHFGTCGGCKWQNMIYDSQTKLKENKIRHSFKNLCDTKVEPIVKCNEEYFYRNKLEFSFTENRWLTNKEISSENKQIERRGVGFHISGMWDKVVDINNCHLQSEPSNKIRISVKEFAINNGISFYNSRLKKGMLRNLMIRNTSLNEFMVVIQFFQNDVEEIHLILNHLKNSFSEITSLHYIINNKENDSIYDRDIHLFYGNKYITESIGDLKFKINPKSFFQTNINQTIKLYDIVKNLANLKGDEIVFDLYSGLGTISQFIAKKAKKVIGIESINEAVISAKESAIENKVNNVDFVVGDMKKIFNPLFISKYGNPDLIITDPPRDGMHKDVIKEILKLKTKKIIYVSCNPSTQYRDLELLKEKYKIIKIQPVDMFPQTDHVENIVLLSYKN